LQTYTYHYNTYAYQPEHWRTFPYTIIDFSVDRYVWLTLFTCFTLLPMRHFIMFTIEITALKTTY
jgi:hypothetical protein